MRLRSVKIVLIAASLLLAPRAGAQVFLDSGPQLGSGNSIDVALADLDGDGNMDAFVANGAPGIPEPNEVWFGDGSGGFAAAEFFYGDAVSRGVALGDLDGDGDPDAFVANQGANADGAPNRVWINLRNGTGNFDDTLQELGASRSQAVALFDLDGDGDLDAVVANGLGPSRVWWTVFRPTPAGWACPVALLTRSSPAIPASVCPGIKQRIG